MNLYLYRATKLIGDYKIIFFLPYFNYNNKFELGEVYPFIRLQKTISVKIYKKIYIQSINFRIPNLNPTRVDWIRNFTSNKNLT